MGKIERKEIYEGNDFLLTEANNLLEEVLLLTFKKQDLYQIHFFMIFLIKSNTDLLTFIFSKKHEF